MHNTFEQYRPSQIVFASKAFFSDDFDFEAAKDFEIAMNEEPEMLCNGLGVNNINLQMLEEYVDYRIDEVYLKFEEALVHIASYEKVLCQAMVEQACDDMLPLDLNQFDFSMVEKYIPT